MTKTEQYKFQTVMNQRLENIESFQATVTKLVKGIPSIDE